MMTFPTQPKRPAWLSLALGLALMVLVVACKDASLAVADGEGGAVVTIANADGQWLVIPVDERNERVAMERLEGGARLPMGTVRPAKAAAERTAAVAIAGDEVRLRFVGAKASDYFMQNLALAAERPARKSDEDTPKFHFVPMADGVGLPAGVAYVDGSYRFYYECNPYGHKTENYHWGEAVSDDLLTWHDAGLAFGGDSIGEAMGGTCVVDKRNTFGAGVGELVAVYTATRGVGEERRQEQCIAYTKGERKVFRKFVTNPVLRTYDDIPTFQRPSIVRYRPMNIWEMVVSCGDYLRIYSAEDLGNWNLESDLGQGLLGQSGVYYLRGQLVEMRAEGQESRWALLMNVSRETATSTFKYETWAQVGTFDGKNFTPMGAPRQLCAGDAPMGWMVADGVEGRLLMFGMLGNMLALPCELSLTADGAQPQAVMTPTKELDAIKGDAVTDTNDCGTSFVAEGVLNDGATLTLTDESGATTLTFAYNNGTLSMETPSAERFELKVGTAHGSQSAESGNQRGEFGDQREEFGKNINNGTFRLFVDAGRVEMFCNGGVIAVSCVREKRPRALRATQVSALSVSRARTL